MSRCGKAVLYGAMLLLSEAVAAESVVMHIAIPDRSENFSSVAEMQMRLARAYAHLGVRIEWEPMPLKRSEAMLSAGLIDGELVRREMPQALQDNTVKVETPLAELSTAVFALDRRIKINTPDDLACCVVGINRNFRTSERMASKAKRVERAETLKELIRMLKAGRVDVILGVYGTGKPALSSLGPNADPAVYVIKDELFRSPGYHYLLRRHAALAADLAKALRQITDTK